MATMGLASFEGIAESSGLESLDSLAAKSAEITAANELAAGKVADIPDAISVASRIEFPTVAPGVTARYFATSDSGRPPERTLTDDGRAVYNDTLTVFELLETVEDGNRTVVSVDKIGGFVVNTAAQADGTVEITLAASGHDRPHELARDSPFGVGEQGASSFRSWINHLASSLGGEVKDSLNDVDSTMATAAAEKRHDIAFSARNAERAPRTGDTRGLESPSQVRA
jgi:hypothetical protein